MAKAKGEDLTGRRFGRLTAVKPTDKRVQRRVVWLCKCDCGNEVEVLSHSLKSGNTKSCGCLAKAKQAIAEKAKRAEVVRVMSYAEWEKAVFERDEHTCRACGVKAEHRTMSGTLPADIAPPKLAEWLSIDMVAHHLTSFDNNPQFRTRVDNGVTLCKKCDDDYHHCYGYQNNTQRQFQRWLRHRGDKA